LQAHRIHWDVPYSKAAEGYPTILVHGPLTATYLLQHVANLNLMNAARNSTPAEEYPRIASFEYKARAPVFCGTTLALDAQPAESGPAGGKDKRAMNVRAVDPATNTVVMDGVAVLEPISNTL
jgi:hydroxyacyl-ACP dehydratase HTD2-like protein with hotdog domain